MKKISILIAVMVLGAAACSKWTEPEALEYEIPTPAQQDKEGYEAYLTALRNYKRSSHKIVMVTMPGMSEKPTKQSQHIATAPDYADYICVYNAENLHPVLVKEIAEVMKVKNTQVFCVVDYMTIEKEWDEYLRTLEEAGAEEMPTLDEFGEYCTTRTQGMLDCCDAYGFSGVVISYTGTRANDLKQRGQDVFMECVQRWRRTHRSLQMVFRGTNLGSILESYLSLVKEARYIIQWTEDDYTSYVSENIRRMKDINVDIPVDRFILESSVPTFEEPDQVGKDAATAANWVVDGEDVPFTKAGLYLSTIQDDYYNSNGLYRTVRDAAFIMNPGIPEF